MRKILLLLLVILSFQAFGQTPPGYQTRIVRERIQGSFMVDSALHIPRYNGTPSGVRVGSSVQDGAIAMDTLNHLLYIYSGGVWAASGSNFANANLTFTGNRAHDANYKSLAVTKLLSGHWKAGTGVNYMDEAYDSTYHAMVVNKGSDFYGWEANSSGGNQFMKMYAKTSGASNELVVFGDSSTTPKIISYQSNINGSLTPNAHATKSYVDSLRGTITSTNIYNSNGILNSDRTLTGLGNTYFLKFDSVSFFNNSYAGNSFSRISSVSAYTKIGAGNTNLNRETAITSGITNIELDPRVVGTDGYIQLHNVQYNSSSDLVGLFIDTLTDNVYRKAAGGGSSAIVDSAQNGIMKFIDYRRNYIIKVENNPTGTITHNQDSSGQRLYNFTSTGGRTLAFSNLRRGDIAILSFDNTSGSNITLTLPSNAYVNLVSAATAVIPTNKSSLSLSLFDGVNYWFTQSITGGGTAFVQDGNSFGASAVLGTNDNNSLSFEINNTSRFTIGTSTVRRLQLGDLSSSSTATPEQFSMGGTYNNAIGASPKLKLYDDNTNYSGVGFETDGSTTQLSFVNSFSGWHFGWYGGSSGKVMDINPAASAITLGAAGTTSALVQPWYASFGTDYSYTPLGGLKIRLYDNAGSSVGFGVTLDQLNYIAPSTIKHSFYNNGAKTFNLTSTQGNFTGKLLIGDSTATANSTLQVKGSFATRYDSTATSLNLDITHGTMGVTATGQTITLPTAASIAGRIYTIKLTASGSCTIATTSSQLIDGATTYSLASQYKYVTVQSTGANWIVIANN